MKFILVALSKMLHTAVMCIMWLALKTHYVTGAMPFAPVLRVTLSQETHDGARLSRIATPGPFSSCQLHYGPLSEPMHFQRPISPLDDHPSLESLVPHTPYYAFLTCTLDGQTYASNAVHFTPGRDLAAEEKVASVAQRHYSEGVREKEERHLDTRRSGRRRQPPPGVVLGVVCGVVCFAIINIAIVFVVRRISRRRARRQRILELQLQQHSGTICNLDEIIAATRSQELFSDGYWRFSDETENEFAKK